MSPRAPARSSAGWALTLVAGTQLISLLDRNIVAILAPAIKADLHIGDAEMGLLYGTVFALFYALFSLPIGRLADGWTRTKLLAIIICLWSLATGFAAFANGFSLLLLSRLAVGIGEAGSQPAGTSLIYDFFPRHRRGFVMAVLAAAIAMGLGGSLVLGGTAAGWWNHMYPAGHAPLGLTGWQFAFLVAAAPGAVIAILMWRLREPERGVMDGIATRPDPHPFRASFDVLCAVLPGLNWVMMARRGARPRDWAINLALVTAIVAGAILATHLTEIFSPRPPLDLGAILISPHALQWGVIGFGFFAIVNLLQTLRQSDPPAFAVMVGSPSLILCIAIGALQSVVNYGVMAFTPSFVMKSYGLSPGAAGLQFGLLAAALGIVGPLISGPLSDWVGARRQSGRAWVTLFSLALSPLIALWVYRAPDAGAFYFRFVFYSVVTTMWMPPLYALMYEQVLPRMRAITASTYIITMTIIGLGIGPYAVGMISDATGNLGGAILSINWVAPVIVAMLLVLAFRVERDQANLLDRARAGGEPV